MGSAFTELTMWRSLLNRRLQYSVIRVRLWGPRLIGHIAETPDSDMGEVRNGLPRVAIHGLHLKGEQE